MPIALDATYSIGDELSGVGVYSRELLWGLAASHPDERLRFVYRPHRILPALRQQLPRNCSRGVFGETWMLPLHPNLFHGLNQRMPSVRFRRSVCTFHDLFVITAEYSTPEFRERFCRQAEAAAERSDLIITVSEFTASQVEDLLKVDRSRLRVIHHGIRALPSPGSAEREPVILHVGAIQVRKNITRLVRAFQKTAPPWRLVLAGSASGYGAEEALDAIRQSPAADRIEVTGYVSPETLGSWYRQASVFAFPSLDEGFGMPVLEAMSHGVPVLTSESSALPEVAGDAALLVNPRSSDSIADALTRFTSDEELRKEYARRGLKRCKEFSWSAAVEKTWRVYRELGL